MKIANASEWTVMDDVHKLSPKGCLKIIKRRAPVSLLAAAMTGDLFVMTSAAAIANDRFWHSARYAAFHRLKFQTNIGLHVHEHYRTQHQRAVKEMVVQRKHAARDGWRLP